MSTTLSQLKALIDQLTLAEIFADALRETDDPYGLLLRAEELKQAVYAQRLGNTVLVFVGFEDASVFLATIRPAEESDRWTASVFPTAESFASFVETSGQSPEGAEAMWESLPVDARELFAELVTRSRGAFCVPGEAGHA